MQYQCARAINVERITEDTVRKTYADYPRKGLNAKQWQDEMMHDINTLQRASEIINAPKIKKIADYYYDMEYCGKPISRITLDDVFTIKNMERDLIHHAGIYHNDIKPDNILTKDGKLYLIDFGRSTFQKPAFPFLTYLVLLSPYFQNEDKGLFERIKLRINKIVNKTNAHGGNISYYAENGAPGVREWGKRWRILKMTADFNGKRILDLGCNQGLFTTHIALEYEPLFTLGVDASEDIIRAADLYSILMGVTSYFKHLNIASGDKRNPVFAASDKWQDKLGYEWDIVSALSLYHWVKDKQELLDYLVKFKQIIIECHNKKEFKELVNFFTLRGFGATIFNEGSSNKYDRPLIKFTRG